MTDFTAMTVDELAVAYNEMLAKADIKFEREKTPPIVKFATKTEGINRCTSIEAMLEAPVPDADEPAQPAEEAASSAAPKKEKKMAAKKTAKKKVAKKKTTKVTAKKAKANGTSGTRKGVRIKELETVKITHVVDDAGRRPGTRAADVFAKMKAWWKRNPNKPVADLLRSDVGYKTPDFNWDKERGHIEVSKIK